MLSVGEKGPITGPTEYSDQLTKFGEWYHSFDSLGVLVRQKPGIYAVNQKCMQGTILGYLQAAIEKSKTTFRSKPSVLELFCADGYYAAHARRMGAGRVTGIDRDETAIDQARGMSAYLFGDSGDFRVFDVQLFSPDEPYDVVLCCGGLYHFVDPRKILSDCFSKFCKRFLIVQSVVSLESQDENYFVSPAPGWQHGCRFSVNYLRRALVETGWKIIDDHANELEGNERLCDRGSVYFFCEAQLVPHVNSSIAEASGTAVFCQEPNKFAPRPHLDVSETSLLFRGYQNFELHCNDLSVFAEDQALQRKQELLTPYFSCRYLSGRTFLDLGASGGFFSFWALHKGADRVTAIDIDEKYLDMIATAQQKFNYYNLHVCRANVADWNEPAGVVMAGALIHWIYSCTALLGSLDAAIRKLAELAKYMLVVEWIDPSDPAIEFFHHTDWNRHLTREPYAIDAFEEALGRHFAKFQAIGDVSPTRKLYVALKTNYEIDLSGPFPLAFPQELVISGRKVAIYGGIDYWSYVFDGGQVIHKQATLDLARREAAFLSCLSGKFFPKLVSAEDRDAYSLLTIEKVQGITPIAAAGDVSASREQFLTFVFDCLHILAELKKNGIQHRDIRSDNILVRGGHPVLIDFGWAVSETNRYFTPAELGDKGRPPDGSFCDTYSMGKLLSEINQHRYDDLDAIFELMAEPDASLRIAEPELLARLLQTIR